MTDSLVNCCVFTSPPVESIIQKNSLLCSVLRSNILCIIWSLMFEVFVLSFVSDGTEPQYLHILCISFHNNNNNKLLGELAYALGSAALL